MTAGAVQVSPDWLGLREGADAAARSMDLVEELARHLPSKGCTEVHDLGCGTGSMGRWLAPKVFGGQHWVLWDRDTDLLAAAGAHPPLAAADGATITVETRERDITRLAPGDLTGAHLITASALLDMMTAEELQRFVETCAGAGCPVLVTLSVIGRVDLAPAHPLDETILDAFNDHQHRMTGAGRLLGPMAFGAAVDAFARVGAEVLVRPSPWRLDASQSGLLAEWLTGWVNAARDQRADLDDAASAYLRLRLAQASMGRLNVTVHHQDLLARPR